MTAAGALLTKLSLPSLPAVRARSFSIFSAALAIRASSASLSIKPAIGISSSISPTIAVADAGAISSALNTVKLSIRARRLSTVATSAKRR